MSTKHVDSVFEAIADLSRLATDLMPLAAIWLDKPLQMQHTRSIRIHATCSVRVEHCSLVDCDHNNPPTHEITECRGNLYNTIFEVDLKDLKTGEVITIKL